MGTGGADFQLESARFPANERDCGFFPALPIPQSKYQEVQFPSNAQLFNCSKSTTNSLTSMGYQQWPPIWCLRWPLLF